MRQRDAGFAIERLAVRGRLFLIGAALLLWLPDFGPGPIAIAALVLVASNLLPRYLCKTYEVYARLGIWCAALRGVDVLLLILTGFLPQAHNTKLWMLCVPIVMVQALARRSLFELIALTALAVGGEAGVQLSAHAPFAEWLRPILFLAASPVAGRVLSAYRLNEYQLEANGRRLRSLLAVTGSVSSSKDLHALILIALQSAVRDLQATAGYVMLLDEENGNQLTPEAAFCLDGPFEVPKPVDFGAGMSGYVAKMGQPIQVHDDGGENVDCDGLDLPIRSAVSVPLINRSFGSHGQAAREEILGALTIVQCARAGVMRDEDMDLMMSLSALMASAIANTRMKERQRATFVRTLESLATALEARDEYTKGHSQRVCDVSLLIGQQMGFGADAMEELRIGTTLHDIGKIGVPDAILNKAGRLSDEEFELMKAHPVIGYEICKPLMLSEGVLMLIRNHHEKLDGSGYPDGLKGGELPLSLRVVCVADAFDAMSSRRPYRNVMEVKMVISELSRGAGIQFDPVVVEMLKDLLQGGQLDPVYLSQWDHLKGQAA
ncbi:MAG: HD domain-containing phosphohydrolase [Fimbriimonadaceae bacterium]